MLHNPSNLYSGGQGILRDNVVDYVTALENKKRAKDEALDKYYQNLPNTINEKGMMEKDIPGLHQKLNEINQYWLDNKDKIKKGNTPENFNHNKLWREARQGANMSISSAPIHKKIADYKANPKKANMFKGPDREQMILDANRSVWEPEYKPLDLTKFDYIPPLDITKHNQQLSRFKPDPQSPVYEDIPGDKLNRTEVINKKLSENDLFGLTMLSHSQVNEDPSFSKHLENYLQKNPQEAVKLNELFTKNYGRPINPDSEGDIATAYNLSQIDLTPTRTVKPNKQATMDYAFAQRLAALDHNSRLIEGRKRAAAAATAKEADKVVTDYIEGEKMGADVNYASAVVNGKDYGRGKTTQITEDIKTKIFKNTPEGTPTPDVVYFTDDGKYVLPMAYIKDKETGTIKRHANSVSGAPILQPAGNPIPMQKYRVHVADVLVPKKEKGAEVNDTETPPATTNPKKSKWDKYRAN